MLDVDVVNLSLKFENFLGLYLYIGSLALDMYRRRTTVTQWNKTDGKLSTKFISNSAQ